jgi:hypothetical protein
MTMAYAKAAAAVIAVLFLSGAGCQTTEQVPVPHVVERKVEVPKSLFECMPEPRAEKVWTTQRDVALYIEQLALAGSDCRTRLAKVRKLLGE